MRLALFAGVFFLRRRSRRILVSFCNLHLISRRSTGRSAAEAALRSAYVGRLEQGSTEFRLLGPLEVFKDGAPVPLGGVQQRALLALLLLAPNEAVPRERVVDVLWRERPPASAINSVQVQVHGLRRLLGPDRIETRGSAYLLHADPGEVDVLRFRGAMEEGRGALAALDPASALRRLEGALGLWRGEPLADLPGELLSDERRRLWDERRSTVELAIEAKLALRRHDEVIVEVEGLITEEPFREPLYGQLMLALYRSGRQADALEVYQRARRLLGEELGVAPGPALRELERAVLRQDASLESGPVAPRSNLPPGREELVGRAAALEELVALVCGDTARLLTLTGPGGVGKTTLAIATALRLREEFVDGVYFVDLAALDASAAVAPAILSVLGVALQPGLSSSETLRSELRGKRALLVLDNFERLLAAGPLVGGLVAAAPFLRVLVTSRRRLRVAAEHEVVVPPLQLPPATSDFAALAANDSVALFVQHALGADRSFALTEQNASAVAAVCRALGGLPLALELAAARVKLVTPQEIVERIEHPLALLSEGARDFPERHQTLRATIDWSYELLGSSGRHLFSQLSVFRGGCTLEAFETVCEADLEDLASLVDHSLVQRRQDARDRARFELLDPVRQYAAEKLGADPGELNRVRRRHALYFVQLAEGVAPQLIGAAAPEALQRLNEEHDNLRAALGYALEHEPELGFQLVGALLRYWDSAGRGREARAWLDQALPHGKVGATTPAHARALLVLGRQLIDEGEHERAEEAFGSALSGARVHRLPRETAFALTQLSWLRAAAGDQEESRALGLEAVAAAQTAQDAWSERLALSMVAGTFVESGDLAQARRLFDRSLQLARQLGDRKTLITALTNSGWAAIRDGDLAGARQTIEEALELARETHQLSSTLSALSLLGAEANLSGDHERARRFLFEGLELGRETGRTIYLLEALTEVAFALAPSDAARAARILAAADHGYEERGIVRPTGEEDRVTKLRAALGETLGRVEHERQSASGSMLTLPAAIDDALADASSSTRRTA
jgi:predicted ATPase/DNA-binding SARP family transcriptional activator